ncbi:MAG: NUDIX domain-containing protein [bacterium]|nr:NUDIX domain-containing protein [bacterium]
MNYEIHTKDRIFGEFFRVDRVEVTHDCFNGPPMKVRRYHLERPEVVAVLLENRDRGTCVMVEQFRYSSTKTGDGWTTEVIGGLIDPGESPQDCGVRESMEETGYQVKELQHWTSFYASVGVSDELIHLYYGEVGDADKMELGGGLAHEHEDLRVLEVPFTDLLDQIKQGKLTDSKSIVALQWLAIKKLEGLK